MTDHPWLPSTRAGVARALAGSALVVAGLTVVIHLVLAHGKVHIGSVVLSHSMIDLGVYRAGVRAFLHGRDPYGPGLGAPADLPFTYTPFSTIALTPLGLVPRAVAEVLSSVVSVIALMASLHIVIRKLFGQVCTPEMLWRIVPLVTILVVASEPVRETLAFGQVNLMLMLMVLVDLVVLRDRRWSGVLIGLAAGIKLIPLIFVLYLLTTRRFRAAGVATATAAGTVALGWILMPGPSTTYFFHLMFDAKRVGGVGYVGNQSMNGALTRLVTQDLAPKAYWALAAVVVVVVGIWTAMRVAERVGEPAGLAVTALTGLLVSPISWSHHWVWWIVGTLVLVHRAWATRSRLAVLGAIAWTVPFYVAPFWIVPHPTRAAVQSSWVRQVFGDTYVLAGLIALFAMAVLVGRTPAPTSTDPDVSPPDPATNRPTASVGAAGT